MVSVLECLRYFASGALFFGIVGIILSVLYGVLHVVAILCDKYDNISYTIKSNIEKYAKSIMYTFLIFIICTYTGFLITGIQNGFPHR